MSLPKLSAKSLRWLDVLADFSIDVQYRPRKLNILPNALSRQPALPMDVSPYSGASLSSMVLEPSWLTKVHLGLLFDDTFGPYLQKAKSSDSEFVMQLVHDLSLLYCRSKPEEYQLAIPDGLSLYRLLLEEALCTPLAGHMGARKVISVLY